MQGLTFSLNKNWKNIYQVIFYFLKISPKWPAGTQLCSVTQPQPGSTSQGGMEGVSHPSTLAAKGQTSFALGWAQFPTRCWAQAVGRSGPVHSKGGLLPQRCPKPPREAQGLLEGTADWHRSLWPQAKAPWAPRAPRPWPAPTFQARATGQALGRVTPLPPPSAPSSFLQGPAWAGNGAYPDPIRMLAQLLPGAHGGRARGG